MATLFRVDSSIRTEGSTTRAVADSVVQGWSAQHPDGTVNRRDLGLSPLPAEAWAIAAGAGYVPADQRTVEQVDAMALASTLADELVAADSYVITSPLYNFGVSQHLKNWVDLLITDPQMAPGKPSAIAGRSAVLVVARGGGYGPGTPRAGWDHATAWVQRTLGEVWGLSVETVETELTLAAVNPAMADLVGLAEESLTAAHAAASTQGRTLAERLVAATG